MFYVFGEDLLPGLVGPFASRTAAEMHLAFQVARGDVAGVNGSAAVVTEEDPRFALAANNLCSPGADRRLKTTGAVGNPYSRNFDGD